MNFSRWGCAVIIQIALFREANPLVPFFVGKTIVFFPTSGRYIVFLGAYLTCVWILPEMNCNWQVACSFFHVRFYTSQDQIINPPALRTKKKLTNDALSALQLSGASWMYPDPNVPILEILKSLYKPYKTWVFMAYNPPRIPEKAQWIPW